MNGMLGSCWRRKTLTHRILPAVLQVAIVIAVWELLHPWTTLTRVGDDSSAAKNVRSVSQNNCPTPSIPHASSLTIMDLSSIISVIPAQPSDRSQTFHSKVDIYARDEKFGYLILYPAGTSVDFGDIFTKLETANKAERRHDGRNENVKGLRVNIEDESETAFRVDSLKISKNDSSFKAKISNSQNGYEYNNVQSQPRIENDDFGKTGRIQDQAVRVRSELGGFGQSLQELKTPEANKNMNSEKMIAKSYKQPSDPFGYLNMLNQNLAKSFPSKDDEGVDTQADYETQIRYQNNQFAAPGSSSDVLIRGVLVDENGERLYAVGFLDRVNKLTTELFGRVVNKSSEDEIASKLLINSPSICQGLGDIQVLFLINSIPQNENQRQLIRDTFVNPSNFPGFTIVNVFLIGKTTSSNLQQRLQQEQARFRDIVQGDFFDTPENNTIKGLMGMRWTTKYCFLAKYIMMINENVFVDTDKLVRGLIPAVKMTNSNRAMFCYFNPESDIPRSGPNAISEDLLPGRTRMRPYCKGFAVLMTRGVIPCLLSASEYVQTIHLDELYLYGILPFVSGTIEVFDLGSKRAFHNVGFETVNCYVEMFDKCPFVATVAFNDRFTKLWEFVRSRIQKPDQGWENERSLWDVPSYKRKF